MGFLMGVLLSIFGYLLGSILFAKIIASYKGIDITSVGSKSAGATNVTRTLGKKYGALVFFLDAFKGFLIAILDRFYINPDSLWFGVVMVSPVIGHIYSYRADFKGGKGVATAFGVVFGISFLLALKMFLVWAVVFYLFRYVSLASIISVLVGYFLFLQGDFSVPQKIGASVIAFLILYKHKDNIFRLLNKEEYRFK
ncbi:MAG: acyl-phosphate glycerol 3-phosphate acyltransferase [Hydrogenobaculum sp.]|nr:MAG: acyl-phosphate glycerol 3-phosphate acyltransferase [Hydrogenobaculum sp.]